MTDKELRRKPKRRRNEKIDIEKVLETLGAPVIVLTVPEEEMEKLRREFAEIINVGGESHETN